MRKGNLLMVQNRVPKEIIEFKSAAEWNELNLKFKDNLILVTFYTNSCPICKSFAPHFAATQKEFIIRNVIFCRMNAEINPVIASQLGVAGVPATVLIKNKEIIHRFTGSMVKAQLKSLINQILVKEFKQKPIVDESDSMYL